MIAENLLQQFSQQFARYSFSVPGSKYLLAVSGGSDSMVMADLFLKSGFNFAVAHCNYSLRGAESDMDEQLVAEWSKVNDITLHCIKFDTKKSAREWKKGTQETARILRYDWFEKVRKEYNYCKIVTAHHANDNVETLLINLFKGTGIGGLHGILPENGYIIRPLLFATKQIIAQYATEQKIPYRDDASNATDDYLRNAVRHNIIPAVERSFPKAIDLVNDSIVRFAEAGVLYHKAITLERKALMDQRGQDFYIPILKLRHRVPLATILYELLLPFGFSSGQVPHVIRLMDSATGHFVESQTHRIIRNRNFLIVAAKPSASADFVLVESAPFTVDTGKYTVSFSIEDTPNKIPVSKDEAYLDLEKIAFPLVLRKWRMGDYLYPFGMKMKKKKVGRLLIDEKVPLHEKDDIRILECGKKIAWVSGIRPDERFKVKPGVGKVLVVKRTISA